MSTSTARCRCARAIAVACCGVAGALHAQQAARGPQWNGGTINIDDLINVRQVMKGGRLYSVAELLAPFTPHATR